MDASTTTPVVPLLGRLFWMMFGPMVLFLATVFIVNSGAGWTTTTDLLFFVILGGMILGKWLEFHGGSPKTATGEPATAADFRRYILMLVTIGPIIWVLANLVGNHLLTM